MAERCPLCGSPEATERFRAGEARLLGCPGCGLGRLEALPSAEELAARYGEADVCTDREGVFKEMELYRQRFSARLREMSRHAARGRLLDVGCSVGYFVRLASEAGWEAEGQDIARRAAAVGRSAFDVKISVGSLRELAFPGDSFDAVTMWHVIEHLPDPVGEIAEVSRILRRGGLLAIETPDAGSRAARSRKERWHYFKPEQHLFYYSLRPLSALLGRHGFEILARRSVGGTGFAAGLRRAGAGGAAEKLVALARKLATLRRAVVGLRGIMGLNDALLVYARKR